MTPEDKRDYFALGLATLLTLGVIGIGHFIGIFQALGVTVFWAACVLVIVWFQDKE